MLIAIVANGMINDYPAARKKIEKADYLIACDGGLRHFPLLGLVPDCVIGDFDSAPKELLLDNRERGVSIFAHSVDKDETDLSLAVTHALTKSPSAMVIAGALGGRIDHELGNLHVLARAGDVPAEIWDEVTSIHLVTKEITLKREKYISLSLIPLTSEVTGITTRGLSYSLQNESLCAGETRGVSNTFSADEAVILVEKGLLLAIRSKNS